MAISRVTLHGGGWGGNTPHLLFLEVWIIYTREKSRRSEWSEPLLRAFELTRELPVTRQIRDLLGLASTERGNQLVAL